MLPSIRESKEAVFQEKLAALLIDDLGMNVSQTDHEEPMLHSSRGNGFELDSIVGFAHCPLLFGAVSPMSRIPLNSIVSGLTLTSQFSADPASCSLACQTANVKQKNKSEHTAGACITAKTTLSHLSRCAPTKGVISCPVKLRIQMCSGREYHLAALIENLDTIYPVDAFAISNASQGRSSKPGTTQALVQSRSSSGSRLTHLMAQRRDS